MPDYDLTKSLSMRDRIVGVWSLDMTTRLTFADARVCEYHNVDPLLGRVGVSDILVRNGIVHLDRLVVIRHLEEAIRTGLPFNCLYRVNSAKFGLRWVHASGQCYYDDDHKPSLFPGVVIDMQDQPHPIEPHAQIVNMLLDARRLAQEAEESMLSRLIEAVSLEAGFALAKRMTAGKST